MKREIYLNGSDIYRPEDFHQQVEKLFGLPSYYGRTLDDFWDCLNSYIDPDIKIIINEYQNIIKAFGPEATAIEDIFERIQSVHPEMEILFN